MTTDSEEGLYDEEGRPVGSGMSPERIEGIIFGGITGFDSDTLGERYDDFIENFSGEYDLDDLLREYGLDDVFEHYSPSEVELRESDEDQARYNLNAGVLTVEATQEGWRVEYVQDDRLKTKEFDMEAENPPAWARILRGDESVDIEDSFYEMHELEVGEEYRLPETIQEVIMADQLLSQISEMKPELELGPDKNL